MPAEELASERGSGVIAHFSNGIPSEFISILIEKVSRLRVPLNWYRNIPAIVPGNSNSVWREIRAHLDSASLVICVLESRSSLQVDISTPLIHQAFLKRVPTFLHVIHEGEITGIELVLRGKLLTEDIQFRQSSSSIDFYENIERDFRSFSL